MVYCKLSAILKGLLDMYFSDAGLYLQKVIDGITISHADNLRQSVQVAYNTSRLRSECPK